MVITLLSNFWSEWEWCLRGMPGLHNVMIPGKYTTMVCKQNKHVVIRTESKSLW